MNSLSSKLNKRTAIGTGQVQGLDPVLLGHFPLENRFCNVNYVFISGVWEVPMVMWQDLNGGRCSMGDACANPPNAEGVYKMLLKNFDRHYTTNR